MKKLTFFKDLPFINSILAFIWQCLFFYVPICFIIALSITKSTWLVQATLEHYQGLFKPIYAKIILNSLLLASFTSIVCLLIGYPVAYFIAIKKREWKNFFLFFLIVPFFVNFLVLTYSWFFVLDRHGLINDLLLYCKIIDEPLAMLNTKYAVYTVMVYAYLPFMIMPLYSSLEKFDLTLLEASKDLGASMSQTFFRLIMPLSRSGIMNGFLLVFVPAFGEFAIPMLLGGEKTMYVGTLISHYFFVGQNMSAGAAFTVLSSIFLALILSVIVIIVNWKRIFKGSYVRGY